MLVIDASVVFKWFNAQESLRLQATTLLKNHITGEEEVLVPDLLFYEITNAWSTKTSLTPGEIGENLARLERFGLGVVPASFGLLGKASAFCKKYKVSAYDAYYAVLAREKKCKLITADEKFATQIDLPFIMRLVDYS